MQKLDPLYSVALSLHHSPAVYALLIGSGLSRSAGIPTGYELTLALAERLGAVHGAPAGTDWAEWYQAKFERPLNYSEVLDLLAKTPAERRAILHSFIERNPDGSLRSPTPAHHAIAKLAAAGTIKVIVTTNFDRLTETALRDAGVEPTIIASEDAVRGATPLVHATCTLVKLHGDYLDTRIRNTEGELAEYPPEQNKLLDEIFDRYGLICAGWSGDWDEALRGALMRAPNRRYPMYWLARGEPSEAAQSLIAQRQAIVVQGMNADSFFAKIAELLEALTKSQSPHPFGATAAVSLAKKYSRSDDYAPEWIDLLGGQVENLLSFVNGPDYPTDQPTLQSVRSLIEGVFERTEILRRCALVAGRWGTPEIQRALVGAIRALGERPSEGGFTWLIALKRLPATICWYAAIVGAVSAQNYNAVRDMLNISFGGRGEKPVSAAEILSPSTYETVEWSKIGGKRLWESEILYNAIKSGFRDIAVDQRECDSAFELAEMMISLEFSIRRIKRQAESQGLWFWAPAGLYVFRRAGWRDDIQMLAGNLEALSAGLFGGEHHSAKAGVDELLKFLDRIQVW